MSTALVVGGTGTTGPHILQGLLDRGHDVVMMHRGVHEPQGLPEVEHLHCDPNFPEPVTEALGDRTFDVVVATYGRLRMLADLFSDRCGQFIGTTGCVVWENSMEDQGLRPSGMKLLASEVDRRADARTEPPYFAGRVIAAERTVLQHAAAGDYKGTIIRYPRLYGPHDLVPREWSIIKRIRDGRPYILVTDAGLTINMRCAARNAAHGVLLAVDQPDLANGEDFTVGDRDQFTLRQWMEVVIDAAGGGLDVVSIPWEIGAATFVEQHAGLETGAPKHILVDTTKVRQRLGFSDVVDAADAIGDCVRWLMENPPDDEELALNHQGFKDRFDYAAEDRLVAAWQAAAATINEEHDREVPDRFHPLPHPTVEVGTTRDQRGR